MRRESGDVIDPIREGVDSVNNLKIVSEDGTSLLNQREEEGLIETPLTSYLRTVNSPRLFLS